jgi:LmbE family N-acetylglucosaminyl deacetylase
LLALAISPHLDDAIFSAGGTIAALTDAGWSVTILTIFTQSVPNPKGFALACQLDKGLTPEADYMALRREEDRNACATIGATQACLPFPEAPHRNYGSAPELFGPTHADDDIGTPIAIAIASAVAAADLILAPQAIGGHVDHVQTVRALRRLPPRPTLWWRDFPYISREASPAEPFAGLMAALSDRTVPIDTERKRAACAAYRTQIGFQFGGGAGLARAIDAAGAVERFRQTGDITLP